MSDTTDGTIELYNKWVAGGRTGPTLDEENYVLWIMRDDLDLIDSGYDD